MITVCIATYNGEKYIFEQLTSILSQISENDEVIISDDGSTDKTIEIISSINDNRIRIFHHQKEHLFKYKLVRNMNYASQNFEHALLQCKGDFIFLADQDDIWKQNKVSTCLKQLETHDLVYHNYSEINDHGEIIKQFHFDNEIPVKSTLVSNYFRLPFAGCCMAFKSNVLKYILPFPHRTITHDQWIGLSVYKKGKLKYIQEPLINRRFHSSNSSMYNRNENILTKLRYTYLVYSSNLTVIVK